MTLQTAVVKTLFIFHLFRHPSQQFFISSGILQQFFISSRIPHLFRHPSAILHLFRHPSSYQVNPLPILKTNFKGKALPILKTTPSIPGQPPSHSKDIHSCVFKDTINFSISKIRWLTTVISIISCCSTSS